MNPRAAAEKAVKRIYGCVLGGYAISEAYEIIETAIIKVRNDTIKECALIAIREKVSEESARESESDFAYNCACKDIASEIRKAKKEKRVE